MVAGAVASTWMNPLGRAILALAALAGIIGVATRRRVVMATAGAVGMLAFALLALSARRAGLEGTIAMRFGLASPSIWLTLVGGSSLVLAALLPSRGGVGSG